MPLFAVHISDGYLDWPWWVGGFVLAALLWWIGTRRITDRDIPRIGVVSAAFFVASQFHMPTGVGSVHLVLNGLAGVLLRHRAGLAIGVGLLLQSLLFEHGGRLMLGLNTCIMTLPALAAGLLFPLLRKSKALHVTLIRALFVCLLVVVWLALAGYAAQIAVNKIRHEPLPELSHMWVSEIWFWSAVLVVGAGLAYLERRWESDPNFALGLLLGGGTVVVTVTLKALLLWFAGRGDWQALASADLVAHTPVVVLEAIAVGFAVRVLAKAKPEWLGAKEGG